MTVQRSSDNSDDDDDASDNDSVAPTPAPAAALSTHPREMTFHCCGLCNKGACFDDVKWLTPSCVHTFHGKSNTAIVHMLYNYFSLIYVL
jgi:hypothetical protein